MSELKKLGRYELRSVLGKGAMGVVYEGFDPTLDRRVAVKTILKSVVLDEETERSYSARFAREAKAVGRLNHPNIVQVYDFGEQEDVAYLVMEFIEGRELRAHFEARERFELAECVRIMNELLGALEFAHEAGVIHRDVKPANVMLDAQRRVKLADFGVARLQDGNDRSRGGTIVGTPAFMAPEQISGQRVDRRTDLFSAGVILYELLTAELPFKGDGAWTVAKQVMQDEPPRPSTIKGRISPAFDRIVSTALAKNPEHRFASAKEFAAALDGALAGEKTAGAQPGSDAEIEFWRSIQNSTDPAEFEVYLKGFPAGVYADLARLRISRLPRVDTVAPSPPAPARDTGELKKLAEETAKLEAELAQREAAYRKRAEEAEARRLAENQARAEAEAQREAEAKARAAAEEKARLAAIEKAQQEAKAEVARREAEIRQREAEFRKREAEAAAAAAAAAKADAEAKARREAAERARREADAKARAEAEEKARKQAEEFDKRQSAIRQREADLKRLAALAPRAKLPVLQLAIGFALVAGAVIGAWYWSASSDEARLAQLTVALEAATKATQDLNLARERQQELRRQVEIAQLAEDAARAKGDQAKLKELQEQTKRAEAEAQKQNELVKQREAEAKKAGDAAKLADAQKQSDTAKAAEKAAQEKLAQEKLAQEKAAQAKAAEAAAAAKAAAEKAAAEKALAEKAAAEKRIAEKTSTPKTAAVAARPGLPNVGDAWSYHARLESNPPRAWVYSVEVLQVSATEVRDRTTLPNGSTFEQTHKAGAYISGGTGAGNVFSPYFQALQELRAGQRWSSVAINTNHWTGSDWSCSMEARHAGREKVTVGAGTFEATKVVVEAECKNIARRFWTLEYEYWFAGDIKRYVKHRARYTTPSPPPLTPDLDIELVSYTPGSPSAAEKPAASEKTAPVNVAAVAPPEGVLPGRYAFRLFAGTGVHRACERVGFEEDIVIRSGSAESISGSEFANLQFQGVNAESVAATFLMGGSDGRLTGAPTGTGYAGTYLVRLSGIGSNACEGKWVMVRKGS